MSYSRVLKQEEESNNNNGSCQGRAAVNVNHQDHEGNSALSLACRRGQKGAGLGKNIPVRMVYWYTGMVYRYGIPVYRGSDAVNIIYCSSVAGNIMKYRS